MRLWMADKKAGVKPALYELFKLVSLIENELTQLLS